jgi:hypothetical protein
MAVDTDRESLDLFIQFATQKLRTTVRDLRRQWSTDYWGETEPPPEMSISANDYAYKAAIMMRQHRRLWLRVDDTEGRDPSYIGIGALGEIVDIVDAAPYLGMDLLEAILPDARERVAPAREPVSVSGD